eukprot:INCI6148.1.p1 GENE.INCI6148.1~~INCI6148.1.p1  ORF type:complete len:2196 (-),score=400.47 INCI6148.1:4293-10349(-)
MGADSVKVHAVKEFRKKLEANRDIRQLKESIAEAEQAAAAASEQARAAVATAEREAKRAASADARKVALKQELLKKQAAYEQGRIDAEHAEAALQAWNRVMHETRVHSDGVGTSDQPGRSTAEAADGEIVAVAAPEAVPRSVTRPICTPLEISATCYASEGMELLWYKDGLPFVIPVHSAADTNDFPQNGPESEDNSLPAGEAVHRRAGVRRSVTNAAGEHHVPHVAVFTLSNEHFVEGKLQAINDAGRKEAHEQRMREREELLASNSDDGANSDLEEEHEEQGVAESADAALRAEDSVMGFGDSVYDSSPRNGRYFDSPRNSQLHAHSVLSGEDPFGGINMNSHGREAMHCDEKFCDTPYPTLAPPSIYNTVVQLTSSANENGNRRVESNAEAKQRPLDELVEDEEAFVLASNHLRDWLGTRAFFDIARGDFMLPDSRAGAERSGRHTATTFADDGFPRHYDVDDNAPTHAARHASNGNLDTGRPATQQSLLCRVVAQAFLKQALRFLPLDLIELPGADDQTEDNGAQGEIEAIRSGDDGASGDSNAEYEDFPAPVGDASNFENRRFKWKITLPAVGEDRTSAKINDNRGAFSYDESTPVTAKHAVDSMSTEGRLTDSSLRVLVSRSPAKFHFADDRMNTSDGAWESAAPAGSGRLVMTTPPRIRSTLYFPSIRFNDKGTYVCHLAKRVENTAESSCVNGVNEWQIVHRRICEVDISVLDWDDSLDQLEQRLSQCVQRCQFIETAAFEAHEAYREQQRVFESCEDQLREVEQALWAAEDTVMRRTNDLRAALSVACREGVDILASISGREGATISRVASAILQRISDDGRVQDEVGSDTSEARDGEDSGPVTTTGDVGACESALPRSSKNADLCVDPHRTHSAVHRVALLWEDISQRVGTWTQPSTDFFQALYALKAAKTVRLVRKKDLAFALSRLAATRRELGEILSARLQSWSDKCVVEANRNMVVKLEATGREDFAGIFAELNAALKVARQYEESDFDFDEFDGLGVSRSAEDIADEGFARNAQYVASVTRAVVKVVRKLAEPPFCDSDIIQQRGLTILCQVLAQWNPPYRPRSLQNGSESSGVVPSAKAATEAHDTLHAMLRAVTDAMSASVRRSRFASHRSGSSLRSFIKEFPSSNAETAPDLHHSVQQHDAQVIIDLALAAINRFGDCARHVTVPAFALLYMLGVHHPVLSCLLGEIGSLVENKPNSQTVVEFSSGQIAVAPLPYAARVWNSTSEFLGVRGDLVRLVGMLRTYKLQMVGASAIATIWKLVRTQWFAATLLWEDAQSVRCIKSSLRKFKQAQGSAAGDGERLPQRVEAARANASTRVRQQSPAFVCAQVAAICQAIVAIKQAAARMDIPSIVDVLGRHGTVPSVVILACRLLLQRTFRVQVQELFLADAEPLVTRVLATLHCAMEHAQRYFAGDTSAQSPPAKENNLRILQECRRAHQVWSLAALLVYLQLDQAMPVRGAAMCEGRNPETWLKLWDRLHTRGVSSPEILSRLRVSEVMFWGMPRTDAAVLLHYSRIFRIGSNGLPAMDDDRQHHYQRELESLRSARSRERSVAAQRDGHQDHYQASSVTIDSVLRTQGNELLKRTTYEVAQATILAESSDGHALIGSVEDGNATPPQYSSSDESAVHNGSANEGSEPRVPAIVSVAGSAVAGSAISSVGENGDVGAHEAINNEHESGQIDVQESDEPHQLGPESDHDSRRCNEAMLEVGDRVEVLFGGGDVYYPGTISAVHEAGYTPPESNTGESDAASDEKGSVNGKNKETYGIVYDDGDVEENVDPALMRPAEVSDVHPLKVGDRVFALFQATSGNTMWYAATVTSVTRLSDSADPSVVTGVSRGMEASSLADDFTRAQDTVSLSEDPVFEKYFKLLSMGMPKEQVALKMTAEGVDARVLDTPDEPSTSQECLPAPLLASQTKARPSNDEGLDAEGELCGEHSPEPGERTALSDVRYSVRYDDGDEENGLDPELVRQQVRAGSQLWHLFSFRLDRQVVAVSVSLLLRCVA